MGVIEITPGGATESAPGGAFAPKKLPSNSLFRVSLAGVQPRWIQGNLKGERHRRGKLVYLIINIKEIKKK